jgi:hypothetical protein
MPYPWVFLLHAQSRQFASLPKPNDGCRVLRSRPAIAFLMAADDIGLEFQTRAAEEHPDTLGRVELVA